MGNNLTLYVPCVILQCVDEPKRCTIPYKLFMFVPRFIAVHVSDDLLVHHQEHCMIYCITQFWYNCAGESSCYVVIRLKHVEQ